MARIALILSLMELCELPDRPNICDLGCGAGWATGILGIFGAATGVDLAPPDAATQRYPHCRFIGADVLKWSHPAESFDLIVSQETLEHIELDGQGRYLQVAHDVLRPRGYLILTTPNRRTMEAFPGGGRTWSNQPIENWLYARELRDLLRQNHFQVIRMNSFMLGFGSLGSYRIASSSKLNRLFGLAGVEPMWKWILGRMNFGLHFAVLARKK